MVAKKSHTNSANFDVSNINVVDYLKSIMMEGKEKRNLTFLAGAGISSEYPSRIPTGRQIMDALIKFMVEPSAIEKVKEISKLRFEFLVQLFRNNFDKELKFLDFFLEAKEFNLIHKFIADQMKDGNYVMTTNFDVLIEMAFGIENKALIPVISAEDFEKYSNPKSAYLKNLRPLYKLHGSPINIVTKEDTRIWAKTTLDSLGKNKISGEEIAIPSYQKKLFDNICFKRTLIVIGYSGGDDLDIVPSLLLLRGIKRIIWINHVFSASPDSKDWSIRRVNETDANEDDEKRRVLGILSRIGVEVIEINCHIASVICEILGIRYKEYRNESRIMDIYKWLSEHFTISNPKLKSYISAQIFYNYSEFKLALEYYFKALEICKKADDLDGIAEQLCSIGVIYSEMGDYKRGLEYYQQAYEISKEIGDLKFCGINLGNIGVAYKEKGEYKAALDCYIKAYEIFKEIGDSVGVGINLSNIGCIYEIEGNSEKSLEYYNQSYKIFEDIGNFTGMATILSNIGVIYQNAGELDKAIEKYIASKEIYERIGNLRGLLNMFNNIGLIYKEIGKIDEAINYLENSYNISIRLNANFEKAYILANMGQLYKLKGNMDKALELFRNSYNIFKENKKMDEALEQLNNMLSIYLSMGNINKAINCYNQAYQIYMKLGNEEKAVEMLDKIAYTFLTNKEYDKALEYYENTKVKYEKLGRLDKMSIILGNIGIIHKNKDNLENAIKYYYEAYKLNKELNNIGGMAVNLVNIGVVYNDLGKKNEAIQYFSNSFKLASKINEKHIIEFVISNIKTLFDSEAEFEKYIQDLYKNKK
ncbi:MAG: tetratricopeptide repeat protein [Promethearchaeota archaeon]